MFQWTSQASGWVALGTLTLMEIVLGIDNVIFISLIGDRLPASEARLARLFGLGLALLFRMACLTGLTWLIALTEPVITVAAHALSWRDIVLFVAGLFLMVQATLEIHAEIDHDDIGETPKRPRSLGLVILTIAGMDLVFSFDSILTAIGMAKDLSIMVAAILISLVVMYAASNVVARFIHTHPTAKVLALSFLVLIGFSLVAEGSGFEIPRGYLYFAMVFSGAVELLNIWSRRKRRPRRDPQDAQSAAAADRGNPL